MYKIIFAIVAFFIPTMASAADWRLVAEASNGQETYLDISTVKKTGAYRTTWEKVLNRTPDADGAMYSVGHWRYNCSRRTVTLLSYIIYRGDGVTLKSNQVPSYIQEAKDVAPDTVGEMMFKTVCR